MLGSLRKIWPWKETVETMVDRHGDIVPKIQANILPSFSHAEDQVIFAIGLAVFGFIIVLALDKLAAKTNF